MLSERVLGRGCARARYAVLRWNVAIVRPAFCVSVVRSPSNAGRTISSRTIRSAVTGGAIQAALDSPTSGHIVLGAVLLLAQRLQLAIRTRCKHRAVSGTQRGRSSGHNVATRPTNRCCLAVASQESGPHTAKGQLAGTSSSSSMRPVRHPSRMPAPAQRRKGDCAQTNTCARSADTRCHRSERSYPPRSPGPAR
jgi:hypothetical protein